MRECYRVKADLVNKHFPLVIRLLIHHILETKGLDYILTGNIHSDPIGKRFGRYTHLSGASYFCSEKHFLYAEKSIRVKSLIKFSGYTMKEVSNIMGNDSIENHTEVEHCGNITTEMLLPQPDHAHMTQIDADIGYCWFYFRKFKKAVTCVTCDDILGEYSALEINIEGMISENCQFFVHEINRGVLLKPSDLAYAICPLSWDT